MRFMLLKRGVRAEDLPLIECGSDFVRTLQHRFPRSRVLWMDAAWLGRDVLFHDAPVGAIVSGLPLLNTSTRKVVSILTGAFGYMRRGAAFYQFTAPRAILGYADSVSVSVQCSRDKVRNLRRISQRVLRTHKPFDRL